MLYMSDQEQKEYNLPQGMPSPYYHINRPNPPPQNFYVLSIMHQMHCLVGVSFNRFDTSVLANIMIRIISGLTTGKSRLVGLAHQTIRKTSGMYMLTIVSNTFGKVSYVDMPFSRSRVTLLCSFPVREWPPRSLAGALSMIVWTMTLSARTRLAENANIILPGLHDILME